MAALLDCTDDRIKRIRDFAGIEGNVFVDEATAEALADPETVAEGVAPTPKAGESEAQRARRKAQLEEYCIDQLLDASTREELATAKRLADMLFDKKMIERKISHLADC